jgi:tRNA dimethylallyltransferase
MDGTIDRRAAIELIKRNTRHYAKRQITWFSKDPYLQWFSPLDYSQVFTYISKLV